MNRETPPRNSPTLSIENVVAIIKNSGFSGLRRMTSKLPSRTCDIVVHRTPPNIRLVSPLDMVNTDWINNTSNKLHPGKLEPARYISRVTNGNRMLPASVIRLLTMKFMR
ncbi:hypothetical protein D3C74_390170 [compost metagenome]